MTRDQMQHFARFGAEARLQAISQERDAILQAFPDLGRASAQANGSLNGTAPGRRATSPATPPAGKRRGMSAAQRKAVGERMKAYWAKRRGEKAGRASDTQSASDGAASPAEPSKRRGMSADARKAQGGRMRAYWAARRREKGAGDGSTTSSRKGRKAGRKK
jgi:hypothetical protein